MKKIKSALALSALLTLSAAVVGVSLGAAAGGVIETSRHAQPHQDNSVSPYPGFAAAI